ncbi:MAG: hypothetical protein BWZ02_02274 [Lentisphaerae bacterium ADurb.BinA184]|nr:MAG: hypothetical protein BWZ02_02274 [Lentisphaerae bacterium ADurb.BinA184]
MQVSKIKFEGKNAVELTTAEMRLVGVSDFGPRLAFFGTPGGANLLYWKPGKHKRGDWDLRGGHRVWVTRPGADECEDTYAPDNGPCEVAVFGNGFCLIGDRSPLNGTRRGIGVKLLNTHSVQVDSFVINDSNLLYSGGVWGLTCTVPGKGTTYGIPVGDGSPWDAFTMVSFRKWAGQGQGGYADDQIVMREDMMVVQPKGIENKRMIQSHHGIIAMSDPASGVTFAKKIECAPVGHYPLNTNIAFYIGPANFMVEMETMGPEQTLKPGQDLHHRETWLLHPATTDFSVAANLTRLFA